LSRQAQTEEEREASNDIISLLTPVIKGYLTDRGFETAVNAQQVFGGHGYIREWGMDQFVRDARIAQIYEGTNGVQAMDLVGRKIGKDGGRAIRAFFDLLGRDIADAKVAGDPAGIAEPLEGAVKHLQAATMWLAQNGMVDPNNAGAGAYAYMQLMGLVSLGWMWLKMAGISARLKDQSGEDKGFHETKIITARYFAQRELVAASTLRKKVEAGAESLMALPVEAF
ncbi:MAG: acyl-CoA dehydrogenase, partial [Sphingomicrobium sp.]